jgi:hypothetical protein
MIVEYWICIFRYVKGPKNKSVSYNENFSVTRLKILSENIYFFILIIIL